MRIKVLVVGGTGLVGNALVRQWRSRGADVAAATYHCHASSGFHQLDMQSAEDVERLIERYRPTIVAVPAANPYVDYCEQHPDETRRVNVDGTLNVARTCQAMGTPMIFYSSDYVFDGVKGVYKEEDATSPINEYGRQKAEAERGVLAANPKNLVIRTSGAYGWQWEPKNFVLQIQKNLTDGRQMKVAEDIRYNPTYVENLAEITAELVEIGASGIFHVVGADEIARYQFALRVAEAFGLNSRLIIPTPSRELGSLTPRPEESSLNTEKVRRTISIQPIGVDEGLRRMLAFKDEWQAYARTLPDPAAKTLPVRR
jgi:dTDP-4-dehydrorhamnose reductase